MRLLISRTGKGCLLLFVVLSGLISVPAFSAQLKLKHDDFVVASEQSNWCARAVKLKIETLQPDKIFNPPDSAYLQINLLGKVRAVASFSCPKIEKLIFTGWSKNKLYYAAVATKSGNWQLKGLFAPPR